eukprot:5429077-Pleurochrysis_carterae.AAC.1
MSSLLPDFVMKRWWTARGSGSRAGAFESCSVCWKRAFEHGQKQVVQRLLHTRTSPGALSEHLDPFGV